VGFKGKGGGLGACVMPWYVTRHVWSKRVVTMAIATIAVVIVPRAPIIAIMNNTIKVDIANLEITIAKTLPNTRLMFSIAPLGLSLSTHPTTSTRSKSMCPD